MIDRYAEDIAKRYGKMSSPDKVQEKDLVYGTFQELDPDGIAVESGVTNQASVAKKKKLPGTDLPQDLGRISDSDLKQTNEVQKTQSVESAGLVVTEKTSPSKSLLPNKPPKEQYDFAVSFIKVGDYETAEYALREFID